MAPAQPSLPGTAGPPEPWASPSERRRPVPRRTRTLRRRAAQPNHRRSGGAPCRPLPDRRGGRSEEHTSELQSPCNLVCRLLLEKKKKKLKPVDVLTTRSA